MNALEMNHISINQAADMFLNGNNSKNIQASDSSLSFKEVLARTGEAASGVKFSKHANQRLENRNINLSDEQLQRLNRGVDMARGKSINEGLLMMDNLAFIVNVKNNTVVTALEQSAEDNVFTNIDGAVIV